MFLLITGLFILSSQIVISWLSHSFVFGEGYLVRPIPTFLILEFTAFAAYFLALEWVRRLNPVRSNHWNLAWIFVIAVLARIIFLPSQMIQETDPYRYIWDGQKVLQGENPYALSPKEAFDQDSSNLSAESREVYRRINHAGVKTIYPPLAQFLFAASQKLSPWQLMGWRWMVLGAEISICVFLFFILKNLNLRQEWLILYAWSPLIIKEFSNSLHLDIFAVLFLVLIIYCMTKNWLIPAFIALAFAVLTKLFAVVFLPFLIIWSWNQNPARCLKGLGIFILGGFILYLPFLNAGAALFEGAGRFAAEWQVNDGLFSLIHVMTPGIGARLFVVFALAAAAFILSYWFSRKPDLDSFGKASLVMCSSLFFLAPAGNPWYYTWIFPFLFFSPLRSLILFSGLIFLYYLDFYFAYHSNPGAFNVVRWIEYGIFYLLLGVELWIKSRRSQLFSPSLTKKTLLPVR